MLETFTYSTIGKTIRLSRILNPKGTLVFAFDHWLEHGPVDFPDDRINPRKILEDVVEAGVDAVMLTPGDAQLFYDIWSGRTSLIVKITGKTNMRPSDQRLLQSIIGTVEDAVRLAADAVAATVYWGSPYEDVMLKQWTAIREGAELYGLPALQLSYPRGPGIKDRYALNTVLYGVRSAVMMGADLIKTYYTGAKDSFAKVVEAASGIPVMMSGGPHRDSPLEFLMDLKAVRDAGAAGAVVGRNIFQATNIKAITKACRAVIRGEMKPNEAASMEGLL
ncbi:MAG: 2-amino-3,7-dideoxy-D-threo-hept-6-ulosonate synthase [Desulfurococcales archaeon]|nr:2-amino-3,7-dideoxy-D-threo-hept-6-ulosonate synthase [Desulfurococcales archaeon]